jgi:hypothetical protein
MEQRMQDVITFMANLQSVPGVVVPPSLLALVVPPPSLGIPVSIHTYIYMVVYSISF